MVEKTFLREIKIVKLSIIVGFKNRDLARVKNYLESLKLQTFQDFFLVFVDYGSDIEVSEKVKSLLSEYPFAKYVDSNSRGWLWSRSHSLNIGFKNSPKTDMVAFTDIDNFFSEKFLEVAMKESSQNRVVYSEVVWANEKFDFTSINWKDLQLPTSGRAGMGGFCLIQREDFEKIRGYDERYFIWGIEDRDLNYRLKHMEAVWIDDLDAKILHQWHPTNSNFQGFYPMTFWFDNNYYCYKSRDVKVRNEKSWGEIPQRYILGKDLNSKVVKRISFSTDQRLSVFEGTARFNDFLNHFFLGKNGEIFELTYFESFKNSQSLFEKFLNFFLKKTSYKILSNDSFERLIFSHEKNKFQPERYVPFLILKLLLDQDVRDYYHMQSNGRHTFYLMK